MIVRSLFAVALAALLAGPSAAHAQKKSTAKAAPAASTTSTGARQLSLGGWIGYEMGDLDGLQLRGEGEMSFMQLAPMVELSFVGAVGYSYLTTEESAFGYKVESTAHLLKLVPAARFTFPVAPKFKLFADAGLGFYYSSVSIDTNVPGGFDFDDSYAGFMLRLAGGGMFQVNPRLSLGGQLSLDPMFGDYDDTTFTILAGLTYKL